MTFDNDRTIILYLFVNGLEKGYFTTCTYRDVTTFVRKTEHTVPILSVILTVYSVLVLAFTVG